MVEVRNVKFYQLSLGDMSSKFLSLDQYFNQTVTPSNALAYSTQLKAQAAT